MGGQAAASRKLRDTLDDRTHELEEARQQQAAMAEVLRIISSSPAELRRVFDAIVKSAVQLCGAHFGAMFRMDGNLLHLITNYNFGEIQQQLLGAMYPMVPSQGDISGRAVLAGAAVQIPDIYADPDYQSFEAKKAGFRSLLAAPILQNGRAIGSIVIYRTESGPFSSEHIALLQTFAAQAVIAIENARLLDALRQRTDDLTESLAQQTATSEVLKVISASPGELEPVFQSMLENAVRICQAKFGTLYRFDGACFYHAAGYGTPEALIQVQKQMGRFIPEPGTLMRRVMDTGAVAHSADYAAESSLGLSAKFGGARSTVVVPMLKDEELVGAFAIYRQEIRPFSEKQIELVQNFAAQAVIAIENARLLNELRQRTDDLTESLEQQTATSEVLKVISSSPGELEPVFQAMLESAVRICQAKFGNLFRFDGENYYPVAEFNTPSALLDAITRRGRFRPSPGISLDHVMRTKQVFQSADMAAEPVIALSTKFGGARSQVTVPMLKDEVLIGAIVIYRQEVRPFTNKQIELVQNFAAQAVIAIENARLLNELRQRTDDLSEALERQTATGEILSSISASIADTRPVFDAILRNLLRLFGTRYALITLVRDGMLEVAGIEGDNPGFARLAEHYPMPLDDNILPGKAILTQQTLQLAPIIGNPETPPATQKLASEFGYNAIMSVPLIRNGEAIGALSTAHRDAVPFTDKQVALIRSFADQAVIAIENTRLLNELHRRTADLTEALEQQTAISDILRVISNSPSDVQPVLDTVAERAAHICEARIVDIIFAENDSLRVAATFGDLPRPPTYGLDWATVSGRSILDLQPVQVADLQDAPEEFALGRQIAREFGHRTTLAVPLVREGRALGTILVRRAEVRPFEQKHIALLATFADQAAIAIENTRLFNELRERTAELEKSYGLVRNQAGQLEAQSQQLLQLNQQLEQRVTDQVGEIERMGRLRRFLPPQVADLIVSSGAEKQLESHRREITALFCDLRGFTGFSESSDPEDVMALLREYHGAIGKIIFAYGGTLERFAGDGVMVIFNDPVPLPNPALQAVKMALDLRAAIGGLIEKWRRLGHELGFGIGIAHGYATLGTVGFEGRFDYAAIGTVSNIASRLCDEAKPSQILITPRVLIEVENAVAVESIGEFDLKGIRRPMTAYNVLAATTPPN